jgi:hypothetical protein
MCVDQGRLYLSDQGNRRILVWNSIPTSIQQSPDIVLGQPDFNSNTVNNGGVSAQSISSAVDIYCGRGRLMVSDAGNHRVLIWNSPPTQNFQAADFVLGQADFLGTSSGLTSSAFSGQRTVFSNVGLKGIFLDTGY